MLLEKSRVEMLMLAGDPVQRYTTAMTDAVSEIKARLNIEDVVSEYVQLKRSGRNFKGLSPFTHERTPSFVVSPDKQIWHDFSSGKGGDVISFIEAVEGLDFKGALELLARKAGIELEAYQPAQGAQSSEKKQKERLFEAIEQAVKFYQVQLMKHIPALKYLREKRGYEKQTLIDFRFGYSPDGGKVLLQYLTAKGYTTEELKKAGLISARGREWTDMFRGRIMIPLRDPQGRAVGFTARQLVDDKNGPKYINTPSTVLYDKSRQVFGLSQAKEAIRKEGFVVVVEGNLDVVASHQAGVRQVVASAGTALTTYHLKSLQRFTGDIRLCFDDDRAGQEAAERAIPLAQSLGVDLSIVSIPLGKDPDELIKEDPKRWLETINSRQYMVDWLIERIEGTVDLKSALGKRQFTNRVLAIVRQLREPVEQEHYARLLAEKTNTSFETIQTKLHEQPTQQVRLKRIKYESSDAPEERELRVLEQHLLAMGLENETIAKMLGGLPLDVFSDTAKEVASSMQQHPGLSPKESEYATIVSLLFEEQYQQTAEEELVYQARRLLTRLVSTYAKRKKQSLVSELSEANETTQTTLLKAVKQLDDLVAKYSSQ
jgi:DNA primase